MISIIVPTYNRLQRLKQVLTALEKQAYPLDSVEVIVVSDGSDDGTLEFLQNVQTSLNLKAILQENQGVAVARNTGVAAACGDIILFIDDDVVPTPQLLAEHVLSHTKFDYCVVIGPMLSPPDLILSPWVSWMHGRLAEQYEAMVTGQWEPTARQFYTGNTSVSRQLLLESGGFDPAFRRAEDIELAFRMAEDGVRFVFNPAAVGYHYEERSFASWIKIPYAYGRNDVIFAREKEQIWLLDIVFGEYTERHVIIRGLVRLCLDRHRLSHFVLTIGKKLAQIGQHFHLGLLTRFACSCLFNLRQYQGISDELGGRHIFYANIANQSGQHRTLGEDNVPQLAAAKERGS